MKNKEQQFQKFDSVSLFCSRSKQEVKGFLLAEKHVDVYTENRWGQLEFTHKEYRAVCLVTKKDNEYAAVSFKPISNPRIYSKAPKGMGLYLTRNVLIEKNIVEKFKDFKPDFYWLQI